MSYIILLMSYITLLSSLFCLGEKMVGRTGLFLVLVVYLAKGNVLFQNIDWLVGWLSWVVGWVRPVGWLA